MRPALALAAIFFASATAAAQKPPKTQRLHWDPAWSHANAADYVLGGVGTTAVVAELVFLQPMRPPLRWSQPILFDEAARGALRVDDPGARSALETTAWMIWSAQLAYPLVVDAPYAWARYGFGAARDLFWQDAVTLTLAGAIDLALRDLSGRIRPDVYDCWQKNGDACLASVESTRSFPGGHIVNSAAAAGLVCTQHLYTRLYGGPWDAAACATTITASATLAMFRILSDNHWATDEIVGAALGGLIGWGVPFAMHFHGHRAAADAKPPAVLALPFPLALPGGAGGGIAGVF